MKEQTQIEYLEDLLRRCLEHMVYKKEVVEDYSAINLIADLSEYLHGDGKELFKDQGSKG